MSNNTRHGGMTVKKFVPVYEGELAQAQHSGSPLHQRVQRHSHFRAAHQVAGVFHGMWPLSRTSTPTPSSPCIPLRPSRLSHRPFCRCRRCRCLPGWGVASPMGRGRPASPPMPSIRGPLGWCATPSSPRRPFGPSKTGAFGYRKIFGDWL